MTTFIINTSKGQEIVTEDSRNLAMAKIAEGINISSVEELDTSRVKVCPNHETCGGGVVPIRFVFCQMCGTEFIEPEGE